MIEVLVGLEIIYIVTPWLILFGVNSKNIGKWNQKIENQRFWEMLFYIHSSLTGFSELLMYKSLSSDNLSLDLHEVSIFWLESDTLGTLSLYFVPGLSKFGRPDLEMAILWSRTVIWSYNLSLEVSLMLDYLFLVPFVNNS